MGGCGGKIEVGLGGFVRVEKSGEWEREVGVCNNGLFIYIYIYTYERQPASQPGVSRPGLAQRKSIICSKKRIVARKALLCRFVSVNADCLRTSERDAP